MFYILSRVALQAHNQIIVLNLNVKLSSDLPSSKISANFATIYLQTDYTNY